MGESVLESSENGSKEVRGKGSQYICDLMKVYMYSSINLGRNLIS